MKLLAVAGFKPTPVTTTAVSQEDFQGSVLELSHKNAAMLTLITQVRVHNDTDAAVQ